MGFPPNESWPNEDAAAAGAATNMEVRRLRKHANALKISGRLRRIHADGAGAHADSSLCLHAAECIDSLLRELERMDRG